MTSQPEAKYQLIAQFCDKSQSVYTVTRVEAQTAAEAISLLEQVYAVQVYTLNRFDGPTGELFTSAMIFEYMNGVQTVGAKALRQHFTKESPF